MIQWIALALAVDAEGKAAQAQRTANEAVETGHNAVSGSTMVIIRPVNLVTDETDLPPAGAGFFGRLFHIRREVLAKEPWAVLSIKRSDILNLREYKDGAGQPYVRLQISEYAKIKTGSDSHLIGAYIPGTIEQIAAIIGGSV